MNHPGAAIMLRRVCFILYIPLFVALAGTSAQEAAPLARIRPAMQRFVDQGEIAGAVTVVGRKDAILSFEAVGYTNLEKQTPMPKDALFRIASMTKPITAMGIMLLQEDGKLTIDDPVEKHLPEFKGQMLVAERKPESLLLKKPSRPITLKDLLTHTSGLPGNYPAGLSNLYQKRDRTLAESILAISQQPLTFEPGTKWSYCNAGIDTLGRVIEVVSGQPYEDFLEHRIFHRLGMADTMFYPEGELRRRIAGLYEKKDGKLQQSASSIIGPPAEAKHPIPAGGLYSTGADLAKLYQMLLNNGELNGSRILKPESIKQMTTNHTADLPAGFTPGGGFGLGFALVTKPQGVTEMLSPGTYGHGGAYGTQGWIDPQQDLFIILLIQRTGLPNADASAMRKELQTHAAAAVR
jgi:CubicO group peptidase (beta-lactamase class C family)